MRAAQEVWGGDSEPHVLSLSLSPVAFIQNCRQYWREMRIHKESCKKALFVFFRHSIIWEDKKEGKKTAAANSVRRAFLLDYETHCSTSTPVYFVLGTVLPLTKFPYAFFLWAGSIIIIIFIVIWVTFRPWVWWEEAHISITLRDTIYGAKLACADDQEGKRSIMGFL